MDTLVKMVSEAEMTHSVSKLWMGIQNQAWHIKNGDSPIFDALVAEMGDPYREPVIAMKNPKEKVEKKNTTRSVMEEVSIEFAKLRKMTRPQLLSYIATNKELLPKGLRVPNSQARKSDLLHTAQIVARAKF